MTTRTQVWFNNWHVQYNVREIKCRSRVPTIGKPNNLKVTETKKTKGLHRIAKLGYGYLYQRHIDISNNKLHYLGTSRSFPHSRFISGFVTRLTRRVPLVEQELLISLFVRLSLFCLLGHCFVCSTTYGYRLHLWYLQTLLEFQT